VKQRFKIIIIDTAVKDIKKKGIDADSIDSMISFLISDGCRSIGDRQKCIFPPKKIWALRVPMQGTGSRGGGRVLYYFREKKDISESTIEGEICVYRIFQKNEVDDGKQKRKNVFRQAIEALKDRLELEKD
jgi:hypothetical protein